MKRLLFVSSFVLLALLSRLSRGDESDLLRRAQEYCNGDGGYVIADGEWMFTELLVAYAEQLNAANTDAARMRRLWSQAAAVAQRLLKDARNVPDGGQSSTRLRRWCEEQLEIYAPPDRFSLEMIVLKYERLAGSAPDSQQAGEIRRHLRVLLPVWANSRDAWLTRRLLHVYQALENTRDSTR